MFTNAHLYMTDSFAFVSQMLGLYVNTYVDAVDEEDYKLQGQRR